MSISFRKVSLIILILIISSFLMSNEANTENLSVEEIIITSAEGDKLASEDNTVFFEGKATGNVISVYPSKRKQIIDGIGTSFTESSAYVLAHLPIEKRRDVMRKIFSSDGADFTLTRTHIGSCDFSVYGKYSYASVVGDAKLQNFTIEEDLKGFDKKLNPNIMDDKYDLLPMIKEALFIKSTQPNPELRIIASAWTAPYWMKDIEEWYIPGAPENNWQGTGGSLKKKYVKTYANYLVKYLESYRNEGVNIWGITPVNEPYGNNGQWESMQFTPETQNRFIKKYLGPKLVKTGFKDVKLMIYDQNRDGIEPWTDLMFSDKKSSKYVYGVAVHWYESTVNVYEDAFDRIHNKFPEFSIIHTEGCIDDLGKDAPNGVLDPIKFKETNWFDNDSFWWNDNATDWAYSVTWQGVNSKDHPAYIPVHRYARNIIVSLDHWMKGWVDWNIVLDKDGGPNHVGNFCGAPIMIDTANQHVYYTPIYYILSQISRTIRPGDVAVQTVEKTPELEEDDIHTCATLNSDNLLSVQVLNTSNHEIQYNLQISNQYSPITIKSNAMQTVRVQL